MNRKYIKRLAFWGNFFLLLCIVAFSDCNSMKPISAHNNYFSRVAASPTSTSTQGISSARPGDIVYVLVFAKSSVVGGFSEIIPNERDYTVELSGAAASFVSSTNPNCAAASGQTYRCKYPWVGRNQPGDLLIDVLGVKIAEEQGPEVKTLHLSGLICPIGNEDGSCPYVHLQWTLSLGQPVYEVFYQNANLILNESTLDLGQGLHRFTVSNVSNRPILFQSPTVQNHPGLLIYQGFQPRGFADTQSGQKVDFVVQCLGGTYDRTVVGRLEMRNSSALYRLNLLCRSRTANSGLAPLGNEPTDSGGSSISILLPGGNAEILVEATAEPKVPPPIPVYTP
jgi:hypothetical protein